MSIIPIPPVKDWNPDTIRALREALGDSQAAFAKRLGLGRHQSVSEYEKARRVPSGSVKRLLDYIARDASRARDAAGQNHGGEGVSA